MISYDISSLDANKTILECLHDIQKYLKQNPIYKVYYANGSYVIGQAQYNLSLLGNNQGTIAEGDVVFFNNNYYAKVASVGSTTFSVFPAVAIEGSGGAEIKTMSQLEFLNILNVLYDSTEGAHVNLTGRTEYTDGTETANSMELLVPIIPKDSSIEIGASADNEHIEIGVKKTDFSGDISNPNLLINSNFAINQRGASSYTGANKYSVDRWQITNNYTTVIPSSSGITVNSGTVAGGCRQIIENGFNLLKGKPVVLSVSINGTVYQTKGVIPSSQPSSNWNLPVIAENTSMVSLYLTTEGVLYVFVGNSFMNSSNSFEWVKLEIGEFATEYVPPLIAEELPKCQRYYTYFGTYIVAGYVTSSAKNYTMPISLTVPMRTTPSMQAGATWTGRLTQGGYCVYTGSSAVAFTSTSVGGWSATGNFVRVIDTIETGVDVNNSTILFTINGIGLDAEIY